MNPDTNVCIRQLLRPLEFDPQYRDPQAQDVVSIPLQAETGKHFFIAVSVDKASQK